VPIMIGNAVHASRLASELHARGVYAVSFSRPVVPSGQARIRTQMSAAHTRADIARAVDAFVAARDATAQ
jgi:glycine C-acetyltransferase